MAIAAEHGSEPVIGSPIPRTIYSSLPPFIMLPVGAAAALTLGSSGGRARRNPPVLLHGRLLPISVMTVSACRVPRDTPKSVNLSR